MNSEKPKIDVEKDISSEKFSKITRQVGFNYATVIAQILLAPVLVALLTKTLTVSEYGRDFFNKPVGRLLFKNKHAECLCS
ncbi:MAG: hypothetical protein HZB67_03245 [Candidatus Aenigmarchaeota archaeon]|nr:hypothetical protein [Candidatus Aenigmarchaeota archaeon]